MRIGTCGWGRLPARQLGILDYSSLLEAYSRLFDAVEVNSTFYRIPRENTAKRWRSTVPDDFAFTVKMYRGITHERRFVGVDDLLESFLRVVRALNAPIILIQTPRSFRQTAEHVQKVLDFLSILPSDIEYALELRGWTYDERFSNWIWVVDPFAKMPPEQDVYYFRLHGSPPGERMYRYRYSDTDLQWLKEFVSTLSGDVWIFFNNIWMYEDALRFKEMMSNG